MDSSKISKASILCLFIALFLALPLSSQEAASADSASCWVELRCEIGGLDVWIDGGYVGRTPLPAVQLEEGNHTLRVRHPDPSGWLNHDWEREVFLKAGTTERYTVKFPQSYWIGSDPSEASVYYDHRYLGKTPLTVEIPADSMNLIVLKKPGFNEYRLNDAVERSSMIHVHLKSQFEDLIGLRDNPKLDKKWIIASSVTALVCGGLGYYFQSRADKAYDKYMKASHPEEMNRHFKDAETLDRYTGVCYGLGEVSLGISLFFLIRGGWSN